MHLLSVFNFLLQKDKTVIVRVADAVLSACYLRLSACRPTRPADSEQLSRHSPRSHSLHVLIRVSDQAPSILYR